jgi:hypothetical protein
LDDFGGKVRENEKGHFLFNPRFNYNFLAPPLLDTELLMEFERMGSSRKGGKGDAEGGGDDQDRRNPRPETEALWYMSESKVI